MDSKGLKLREELKRINSDINQQIVMRNNLNEYSKEYREPLAKEIELVKEKAQFWEKYPIKFNVEESY